MSNRPQPNEFAPYFSRYIDLVPEEDISATMEKQGNATASLLRSLDEQRASFRYAPGKWSVKQVVGHVTDTERVFAYRALSIARGETKPLPGFDEQTWAAEADFDTRSIRMLIDDLTLVRRATLALFRSLPADAWNRVGVANDKPISVRALAYNAVGHERHHLKVLRERYGVLSS
jgi:hypothetical protein